MFTLFVLIFSNGITPNIAILIFGFITLEMVYYGKATQIWEYRKKVLSEATCAHPERFLKGVPSLPPLPNAIRD